MRKMIRTTAIAAVVLLATAAGAQAGSPTCADFANTGWENHGAHVLTYVHGEGGAAGGAPAHHPIGHAAAPGASFCLDQAMSPGH